MTSHNQKTLMEYTDSIRVRLSRSDKIARGVNHQSGRIEIHPAPIFTEHRGNEKRLRGGKEQ